MLEASGSHVVRAVSILIAACLAAFPAYAKYSGGTGEPNDPYQIATAADLIALGETPEDYDKHFILTADIDLDPNLPGRKVFDKAVIGPDTDPPNKYLLNPYDGTAFTGVFDGDGHTISHLTINGESYLGLFGHFGEGYVQAEVRNLGIADVNIVGSGSYVGGLTGLNLGTVTQCYATGVVTGDEYVGGLTGFNWGTVTQCYGTGVVTGDEYVGELVGKNYGSIAASYSTGAVSGGSSVGGLVGSNGGTVTNCYNTGVVTGSGAYVGGLMGINEEYASVTHSYSTGAVRGTGNSVGGLVGENDESALISDCYSTGVVSASEAVGGLVGGNGGTVSRCYSTGAVTGSGQEYIGGLVGCPWVWGGVGAPGHEILGFVNNCFWDNQTSGQATSGGGTGKTTAQMQDPNTFVAVGWDFVNQPDDPHDIWSEPEGGGYPILYWQLPPEYGLPSFSGGTGEPNDPYTISTAEQLNHIGHNPRLMKCHFKLIAALDLTGSHFYPIGDQEFPYGGIFEGDGRTISNLTIMGDDCLGLFGRLEAGAVVKELGVVDVNVTGSWDVGGLVGANGGTVTQCYSTGAVSGAGGGLVGANGGTVTQCFSTTAL